MTILLYTDSYFPGLTDAVFGIESYMERWCFYFGMPCDWKNLLDLRRN